MSTVTLRYLRVLIVLAAIVVPTAAAAVSVSITIDGDTFFGQDSISLGGLSPLIQPSGSPSVLTATDTPTVKSLGITNFSLVGPDAGITHFVTVGATFSGLPFDAFGTPTLGMDGSYTPATPFILGGILDVNALVTDVPVVGPVTDLNLPTPLTFPDAFANATTPTDLIYEPANDIRVVLINQDDPSLHSCDTETLPPAFNPNNFSCVMGGGPVFLPANTPISMLVNIETTFAFPGDQFTFPGSIGLSVSPTPEPSTLPLFSAGLALLELYRRVRAKRWRTA